LSIGLFVPLAAVALYFISFGLWDRILLIFKIGFGYTSSSGMLAWLPPPFGFPIFWVGVNNTALLIFGLMGMYRWIRRAIPLRNMESLTNLMLVVWLIVSLMEAGLRHGGWEHYALLVVPPLALAGALEINAAYERWQQIGSRRQAAVGMAVMSALVILNFVIMNYNFFCHFVAYELGTISRQDFIDGYTGTSGTGPDALYAESIGQYLQDHTNPNDLIYVASTNVQIYYYADRIPPVDVLWPDYLFLAGPPEQIFNPRTKYIVLDTPKKIDHPQWLMDGLARSYDLETVIGGQQIYRRQAP
jgi:hypothetical protein